MEEPNNLTNESLISFFDERKRESQFVALDVFSQKRGSITVVYEVPDITKPADMGHQILLWRGRSLRDISGPPRQLKPIKSNERVGDMTFDNLDLHDDNYVIVYATGNSISNNNFCSLMAVGKGIRRPRARNTSLWNPSVAISSVTVSFTVIPDATPSQDGAWIGVWKGDASYQTNALKEVPVRALDSSRFGTLSIDSIDFEKGEKYTLAYCVNGYNRLRSNQNSLAALYSFMA